MPTLLPNKNQTHNVGSTSRYRHRPNVSTIMVIQVLVTEFWFPQGVIYYDNKNCSHSTSISNIEFNSIYFNNIKTATRSVKIATNVMQLGCCYVFVV